MALFVLFSSATVPVGSPGHAVYVSANAALEARFGMPVPLAAVTETLTLDGLARRIAEAVRAAPAEAEAAALLAAHEPSPTGAVSGNDDDTMGAAA